MEYSNKQLLALDVTGDFTKVNVTGFARHRCHKIQHTQEHNSFTQAECTPSNEDVNLKILQRVCDVLSIKM